MGEGRIRKDLQMPAENVKLEHLKLYLVGDSGQSSKDQNVDRHSAGKDQFQVSAGKKRLHWLLRFQRVSSLSVERPQCPGHNQLTVFWQKAQSLKHSQPQGKNSIFFLISIKVFCLCWLGGSHFADPQCVCSFLFSLLKKPYTLAESLSTFCSHLEILPETEIKCSVLINMAEVILRQSIVEAVAWLLLGSLARLMLKIKSKEPSRMI